MKKVHAKVGFGYCNAYHEDDFEFDDDATPTDIYDEIFEWAQQFIDIDFEVINEDDDEE